MKMSGKKSSRRQDQFPLEENGVGYANENSVETRDKARCCWCGQRFNPCRRWSLLCSWFVHFLQRLFSRVGGLVARGALVTVALCVIFAGFCALGFVWLKHESRTEKLFIPQASRAIEDLNVAEKFFPMRVRNEGVILVVRPGYSNILVPKCMREALEVHSAVTELKSFSDLCVTVSGGRASSSQDCVTLTPFEIFEDNSFDSTLLEDIQAEISQALRNFSLLMKNGRPFQSNFNHLFGGVTQGQSGKITSATALQLQYLIRDPAEDDASKRVYEWEKSFIDKVASLKPKCFHVYYEAARSTDDAIAESTVSDVTLVSVTFMLMISFACFMLGKLFNPLTGHSLLANAGILAVGLGILTGIGLAMWCGVTFVSLVGVVPFLVLGVGIDDMFILIDELDRQPRGLGVIATVKEVMARSGATITMTTLTDLIAFAVSTSTSFPAIRYFCIYAALTVTFSYFMMVTFFVACMAFDIKRIKAGRRDCLPLCIAPPPKTGRPPWDEPIPQVSNQVLTKWARFLMFPATKIFVIIFSLVFLALGIYGATQVNERFDRNILAKDDSYLKRFISVQERYFEQSIPVSIVLTEGTKYEESATQNEIRKLSDIVAANTYYENSTVSWMDSFDQYSRAQNRSFTGSSFMPALKAFLDMPQYALYKQDLKVSQNKDRVLASRILAFIKSTPSSTDQTNAMLTIREDIARKSELDAFAISRWFIFFEQYAIITKETIRNLIIATLAVLLVTSFFLIDCTVTLLVVLNFMALVLELFGLMFFWDVSLNGVSMINLVMAIGFAVDYSAHIAHAYVMSEKESPNERVIDSLSKLGASVFMGGFSTFLGMTVLVFAASEIFRIFFRMFLGIVLFGLLHGLCFLPVYLSLFCWRPSVIHSKALQKRMVTKDSDEIAELNV